MEEAVISASGRKSVASGRYATRSNADRGGFPTWT
jgi:hypothetical protein